MSLVILLFSEKRHVLLEDGDIVDFQDVPPSSRRLKFVLRSGPGRCDTATRGSLIPIRIISQL